MRTLGELKHFYQTDLLADLKILDQKRQKVLQKFIFAGVIILCVVGVSFFLLISSSYAEPGFIIVPIVISVIIGLVVCKFVSRDYVREFKILVIDRMIHFIDENLSYDRKGYITKSTFMLSEIFKTKPNRYSGDDLVWGRVGATDIKFCELDAEYESGSGKNRHVKIIFKGLFFIGDFNKDFSCRVVVLPDKAEKLFGLLGQKLQSMNITRDQLIKLDDPEFEKHFVVYSNDQIQARYILSTSLMKRIVDFKKKTNRNIHLSFVGSRIFVAVSYTRNLFEPRIFQTLLDFEPIAEYFEDLQLAIGTVDDLNLNTRIWSKQ